MIARFNFGRKVRCHIGAAEKQRSKAPPKRIGRGELESWARRSRPPSVADQRSTKLVFLVFVLQLARIRSIHLGRFRGGYGQAGGQRQETLVWYSSDQRH